MLSLSNFESNDQKNVEAGADGDYCLTVDYLEFHSMQMAAKGTGYRPELEANKIRRQVQEEKIASLKEKVDCG
jgi:hypothetical protein